MEDPDSMVELWRPRDYAEAHAIRQALEDQGIPCHIDGANAESWSGVGNTGRWRIRLLTLRKFYKQARELIEGNDWPSYRP